MVHHARLARLAAFLTGAALLLGGKPTSAQPAGVRVPTDELMVVPARPQSYGTTSQIVETVLISEFAPPASTFGWAFDTTGGAPSIYQTTAVKADWWARLMLPTGAIVDVVELQACDSTATGQILFGLNRADLSTGANVTPVGSTGTAAAFGCAFSPISPSSPLTIDNGNYNYWLFVEWEGDFTSNNRVAAVHVYYHLQVSPAPATATFSDVPTSSPQFRFVEALAAAGITAGCGGGNYCPNQPVTRGQMAVFLSTALGLHWQY
jgi:S-layer family protein